VSDWTTIENVYFLASNLVLDSRLQADEVKVFETIGGDLPVDDTTVKLESKPSGRPDE
jgi:hypothetical protein